MAESFKRVPLKLVSFKFFALEKVMAKNQKNQCYEEYLEHMYANIRNLYWRVQLNFETRKTFQRVNIIKLEVSVKMSGKLINGNSVVIGDNNIVNTN